jgi:AcrR family transcriptional regulator
MSGIRWRKAVGSGKEDRRIRRTRESLLQALLALMIEKGYEALTVQDILDRANVGRSTFYTHFRDKQELLVSGLENLRAGLAAVQAKARASSQGLESALAFTHALFDHVDGHRALYRAIAGRQSGVLVQREFQRMFASLARHELAPFAPRGADAKASLDLAVSFLASALYGLITEWLDHHPRISPQEMDRIFHRLALPGVIAVFRSESPRSPTLPSRTTIPT